MGVVYSTSLHLAEDGEGLDGFVVVGDEIHHPVAALPQLLCVHRSQPPGTIAAAAAVRSTAAPATVPWHNNIE